MIQLEDKEVFAFELEHFTWEKLLDFFKNGHINDIAIVNSQNGFEELYTYQGLLNSNNQYNNTVHVTLSKSFFDEGREYFKDTQNHQQLLPILDDNHQLLTFMSWNDKIEMIPNEYIDSPIVNSYKQYQVIIFHDFEEYSYEIFKICLHHQKNKKLVLIGSEWDIIDLLFDDEETSNCYKYPTIEDCLYGLSKSTELSLLNLNDRTKTLFLASYDQLFKNVIRDNLTCDITNSHVALNHIMDKKTISILIFLTHDMKNNKNCLEYIIPLLANIDVIGYISDDDEILNQTFSDACLFEKIYPISAVQHMAYDKIVLCSIQDNDWYHTKSLLLQQEYKIASNKITDMFEVVKLKLIYNYRNTKSEEIKDLLYYLENHNLNVFGNYMQGYQSELWKVFFDEGNNPYVLFEGKKMYYPTDYYFNYQIINGEIYIKDIMYEQYKTSPHLYLDDKINIKRGDVIVDAGVCEGNFALRFIDIASKIYLVECDPGWMNALKKTFYNYKEKVVFSEKILADYDDETHITLDTLVEGRVDFVKMDVEGSEVAALKGAGKILCNQNVKLSVCTYHRKNDYDNIKEILESYGFCTYHTSGYMLFVDDLNFIKDPDLRRGIIKAEKCCGQAFLP